MPRRFCQLQVTLPNALVEGGVLTFDPIQDISFLQPRSRHFDGKIDQQNEIGLYSAGRFVAKPLQRRKLETAAISLIGQRRIRKSIAEHEPILRERRANHFGDVPIATVAVAPGAENNRILRGVDPAEVIDRLNAPA